MGFRRTNSIWLVILECCRFPQLVAASTTSTCWYRKVRREMATCFNNLQAVSLCIYRLPWDLSRLIGHLFSRFPDISHGSGRLDIFLTVVLYELCSSVYLYRLQLCCIIAYSPMVQMVNRFFCVQGEG